MDFLKRYRVLKVVVAISLSLTSPTPSVALSTGVHFFVSPSGNDEYPGTDERPFRTIARAQAAVRPLTEDLTDVTVYLRAGVYAITESIRFDHRDSGLNGHQVIYRAFPGEEVVISGGQKASGWVLDDHGVYRAPAGGRRFRQLYVNGARAIRARHPNGPGFARLTRWEEETRRIVVPRDLIGPWARFGTAEMVILKQWTQNNLRIKSVDEQGLEAYVVPMEPDRSKAFIGHAFLRFESQSIYFENALEFLDEPGEWYLREATDEVFYRPRAGEDLADATVVVPLLEHLVEVRGSPADPIHDFAMIGLVFEYSGWTQPNQEGFVTSQADAIYAETTPMAGRVPAAVHVEHAERVRIEGNLFRRLGGTALTLHTGINEVQVIGNRIEDVSGSGIVLDGLLEARPLDPRLPCRRNLIANNLVERIGLDYRSSVGILVGYTSDSTIEHNEVHDAPYTGISVGWGWTDARTVLARNQIRFNHIYTVMTRWRTGQASIRSRTSPVP